MAVGEGHNQSLLGKKLVEFRREVSNSAAGEGREVSNSAAGEGSI